MKSYLYTAVRNNGYTLDFSVTDYYYIHTTYEEQENGEGYYPPYTYIPIKTDVFNPPIEVELIAVSPELYPYLRTKDSDLYGDDELKMISEPEITFSNVHNGIGIVGAVGTVTKQIDIPPFPGGKDVVPRR